MFDVTYSYYAAQLFVIRATYLIPERPWSWTRRDSVLILCPFRINAGDLDRSSNLSTTLHRFNYEYLLFEFIGHFYQVRGEFASTSIRQIPVKLKTFQATLSRLTFTVDSLAISVRQSVAKVHNHVFVIESKRQVFVYHNY